MWTTLRLDLPTDAESRQKLLSRTRKSNVIGVYANRLLLRVRDTEVEELSTMSKAEIIGREPAAFSAGAPGYHSYESLTDDLQLLSAQYPAMAEVTTLATTAESRSILALRISPKPNDADVPRFLFVGCHHAREWISVEVPYLIAERLLSQMHTPDLQPLLDSSEFWFIPMLNPDGHAFSQTDATTIGQPRPRCWRKNRRRNSNGTFGVDLNRNYDIDWLGAGSSSDPGARTYRGPDPFSEPETQAIKSLVESRRFAGILSYHSYSLEVVYPFGFANPPCDAGCRYRQAEAAELARTMTRLSQTTGGQEYRALEAIHHYDDAEVSGDCADWIFANTQAMALTIELRPARDDQWGFELPEDLIQPTFEESWVAALHMIRNRVDKHSEERTVFNR